MNEEKTQGIDAKTTAKDRYNTRKKAKETELLDLRAGYGQHTSPTLNSKYLKNIKHNLL